MDTLRLRADRVFITEDMVEAAVNWLDQDPERTMTTATQRLQVGHSALTRRVAAYRLAQDERTDDDDWSMVGSDDDNGDEWTLVDQLQLRPLPCSKTGGFPCKRCKCHLSTGPGPATRVSRLWFPDRAYRAVPVLDRCAVPYCRRTYGVRSSFQALIQYLDGAQRTLHVYVHLITCREITSVIIAVHRRLFNRPGCEVLVITSYETADDPHSTIPLLERSGVPVLRTRFPLHSKFSIIDSDVLLEGSFNYSLRAHERNDEHITVHGLGACLADFIRRFWARRAIAEGCM